MSERSTWKHLSDQMRRPDTWAALDRILRTWGPLVLVVLAVCYYGQYYRSDLNLGGEGGTTGVIAMRLMEGQRPIVDTFLGYNVMWFWPVAWLFTVTGPNYIALSIYFFTICTITAVLGFLIVRRATGAGWLALGVGALLVLIPGMLFRNYMGLLPVLNAWALLHAFVWEPGKPAWRWLRFAIAGLVLGLTFLTRIDVGMFLLVIYLGLVGLFPFGVRGQFLRRTGIAAAGAVVCFATALAIHVPFYLHARARGYDKAFVEQYSTMLDKIRWEATKNLPGVALRTDGSPDVRPSISRVRVTDSSIASASESEEGIIRVRTKKLPPNWRALEAEKERQRQIEERKAVEAGTRPRPDFREAFRQERFYDAAFILALYLPILVSGLVIPIAGCALLWALLTRNPALKEPALVSLVTLGCALTIFSQYFFFRPDTPHLAEFMASFLVAMACASFFAIRRTIRSRSWIVGIPCVAFVLLCASDEFLFFHHSFPKESAGTIEAARKRAHELVADNGVRVLVRRREQPWMQALHDTVVKHSTPDDWVVTFPYSPTVNFMTNRRSYLHNLYVDNASAERKWSPRTISEIDKFQPAVIVIDQRAINKTEASRFRNWASDVYQHIRERYVLVGVFNDKKEIEVFVRPDKLPPQA
jgi:hypothetical protein